MSVSIIFFFSSKRRHTRCGRDWSSDVCSSDLPFRSCFFYCRISYHLLFSLQTCPFCDFSFFHFRPQEPNRFYQLICQKALPFHSLLHLMPNDGCSEYLPFAVAWHFHLLPQKQQIC